MPLVEVIKEYPREVFIAMGMRMAENISYYIFTVISITYAVDYLGLDKDVIILPWYFEKRSESLKFFADRGHKQVIAGYYDHRPEQVKEWLTAAKALPDSVTGVMYTTWQNKYDDLESFVRFVDEAK